MPDPTDLTLLAGADSDTNATPFEAGVAPAFVIGTAVFGIFWGVVNALLVSHSDFASNGHFFLTTFLFRSNKSTWTTTQLSNKF